jgi:hypothetical protein
MSSWIDFAIYATQIVMLWVLMPRQSMQFTVPAILDRDPEWPAKHADVMAALRQSRWFVSTFYVFAAVSIAVLLALQLGVQVPPFSAVREAPSWRVLQGAHGALMVIGLLAYFACFFVWLRWLRVNVPLAARRHASLTPRVASDYVPLPWRVATEILTVVHIAAWLVAPALGFGGGADYWGRFAFIAAVTVLFAALSYLLPQRRQGYADRLFGDAYRRVELRVVYLMRVAPLTTGAIALGEAVFDLDLARAGYLALILILCGLQLAFLRLRPIELGGGRSSGLAPFGPARRSVV